MRLRKLTACRPCLHITGKCVQRQIWLQRWRLADFNGPQRTADREDVLRVVNPLVP